MSKFVDDNRSRISSTDKVSGFLADKLQAGTNISISVSGSGSNESIIISAAGSAVTDYVAISATDTTPDYLNSKIGGGTGISLTTENSGGDENIRIDSDGLITVSATDTTPDYLNSKFTSGPGVNFTIGNAGGAETLHIDAYGINRQQVFYVGKHGSDAYDGLTPNKAFLTFTAAISAASGNSPDSNNKYAIVCEDAGIYNEQINVDGYVDIFAPNATLSPSSSGTALTVNNNSFIMFRGILPQAASSTAISKANTTGDAPNIIVGRIDLNDSSYGVINLSSGSLLISCGSIYLQDTCVAIGDSSTNVGHTHVSIRDIYFRGSGSTGVLASNSSTVNGTIDHILNYNAGTNSTALSSDDGTIDLTINKIDCDTAYNITSTAILNLRISNISGDEIVDSESNRNILNASGPVGLGFVPIRVNQDGYGIWSRRTSDSLALYSSKANKANDKSIIAVADVNATLIDPDHKIMSFQWVDNVDGYHEVWYVKEQEITAAEPSIASLLGTDPDAGFSVGVILGSDETYSSTGSKLISIVNNTEEKSYIDYSGNLGINMLGNGQECGFKALTQLYTVPAAADGYSSIQIPQYAIVIGVSSYVVASIPGTSSFDIGISGYKDLYGSTIPSLVGVSHPGTDNPMETYNSATFICITPDATPSAATGQIRITIHYIEITPASS